MFSIHGVMSSAQRSRCASAIPRRQRFSTSMRKAASYSSVVLNDNTRPYTPMSLVLTERRNNTIQACAEDMVIFPNGGSCAVVSSRVTTLFICSLQGSYISPATMGISSHLEFESGASSQTLPLFCVRAPNHPFAPHPRCCLEKRLHNEAPQRAQASSIQSHSST